MSDGCHRKLNNVSLSYYKAIPMPVGDSPFTCGGCRDKIKLQILLTAALKLLTYPYVPPSRFRKEQPPDYPYAVLI